MLCCLINVQNSGVRKSGSERKMRACANLNELLVFANMESYNAVLIGKKIDWKERMVVLRKLTRT